MKFKMLALLSACLMPLCAWADGVAAVSSAGTEIPLSLKNEAKASIQRGVDFLLKRQGEDGSWCADPAVTGLCVMALSQSGVKGEALLKSVEKGRSFMLTVAQKDGSFRGAKPQYANYTTAVCLSSLAILKKSEDEPVMKAARNFLIDLQLDEDNKEHPTKKDNPFYGGIGYGSGGPEKPDLSNTQWALEALYLTEYLDRDKSSDAHEAAKKSDLAWKNAIQFLQHVQNVPESADQSWVVSDKDKEDDGGFVYLPGNSKASDKYKDAETLRSYGSMTYAGLKSMVYARLSKDDWRVKAAVDWASKHYTLDENPGMGAEGLYYYLQTFAKANAAFGEDIVKTPQGPREWRLDLVKKLLQIQKGSGEWINENGRWMESVPELVTAYALISMEVALGPAKDQ